jgi:hypothetical protein
VSPAGQQAAGVVVASASAAPAEPASLSTLNASADAAAPAISPGKWWRPKGTVTLTCTKINKTSGRPKTGSDCGNVASSGDRLHLNIASHSLRRGGTVEYYWGVKAGGNYCLEDEYHHRGDAGVLKSVDMTQKRNSRSGSSASGDAFLYKGERVVRWRAPNDFAMDVQVCVRVLRTGKKRANVAEGCYTVAAS